MPIIDPQKTQESLLYEEIKKSEEKCHNAAKFGKRDLLEEQRMWTLTDEYLRITHPILKCKA